MGEFDPYLVTLSLFREAVIPVARKDRTGDKITLDEVERIVI